MPSCLLSDFLLEILISSGLPWAGHLLEGCLLSCRVRAAEEEELAPVRMGRGAMDIIDHLA